MNHLSQNENIKSCSIDFNTDLFIYKTLIHVCGGPLKLDYCGKMDGIIMYKINLH